MERAAVAESELVESRRKLVRMRLVRDSRPGTRISVRQQIPIRMQKTASVETREEPAGMIAASEMTDAIEASAMAAVAGKDPDAVTGTAAMARMRRMTARVRSAANGAIETTAASGVTAVIEMTAASGATAAIEMTAVTGEIAMIEMTEMIVTAEEVGETTAASKMIESGMTAAAAQWRMRQQRQTMQLR